MSNNERIRILMADDQPLFIHSLARVIENRAEDILIIGILENGQQVVEFVTNDKPDIILMDIKMPVMNGVEAVRLITQKFPEMKIMMLTTFDEDEFVLQALEYGAKGYLLKNILPDEVITAIRALHAGIDQISPEIVTKLAYKLNDPSHNFGNIKLDDRTIPQWYIELTQLERSILGLVVQGLANKEIAYSLNLAEQTVKNYLSTIYDKMGVHKRSLVVAQYHEDGIREILQQD
jgi:DNA-binding NarL/FixJ family response regulator